MIVRNDTKAEVTRHAKGGLFVDIKRQDYSTNRLASAANLSRVLQKIGTTDDFLLITPFRGESFLRENGRRFVSLPNSVRSLLGATQITAYWLVGHWTQTTGASRRSETAASEPTTELVDYLEYSWLLINHDKQVTRADWLLTAALLADGFGQDAFVIRLDGATTLRARDGFVWEALETCESILETWATLAVLRSRPHHFNYADVVRVRAELESDPLQSQHRGPASDSTLVTPSSGASSYAVIGDGSQHAIDFFIAVTGNIASKMYFTRLGVSERLPNDDDSISPWIVPTPGQLYAAKWIRGNVITTPPTDKIPS